MRQQQRTARTLLSSFTRSSYLTYHKLRAKLLSGKDLDIIVSNRTTWAEEIKQGFAGSRHRVVSGDLMSAGLDGYDLILPLTIEDIEFLNQHRDDIRQNLIPIPNMDTVELCDRKDLFIEFMTNNGYGEYIPGVGKMDSFPYILKKKVDSWGKNCHIINNPEDEKQYTSKLNNPDYFCQEMIPGKYEFATHILYLNGKICRSINIRYFFENELPIKGQDEYADMTITSCPYLGLFSSILKLINYEGLCCFNYKIRDNQPLILEINPRFGGSLAPYFFSLIPDILDCPRPKVQACRPSSTGQLPKSSGKTGSQ